mgnify:CR=1 FL=1
MSIELGTADRYNDIATVIIVACYAEQSNYRLHHMT